MTKPAGQGCPRIRVVALQGLTQQDWLEICRSQHPCTRERARESFATLWQTGGAEGRSRVGSAR